jgi:uncharacterized protein YycO
MILQPLDILVFKGYWWNPVTGIIFTRTSTTYTHCAVYAGNGLIVEAVASGVKKRPVGHYAGRPYKVMRYRHEIHPEHVQAALGWLECQVENAVGYDYLALLGFLTGWKAFDEEDKFYCAELPAFMLKEARVDLFNEIPSFIYPCTYIQHIDFKEVQND